MLCLRAENCCLCAQNYGLCHEKLILSIFACEHTCEPPYICYFNLLARVPFRTMSCNNDVQGLCKRMLMLNMETRTNSGSWYMSA